MSNEHYKVQPLNKEANITLNPGNGRRATISLDDDEYWPLKIELQDGYHSYYVRFKKQSAIGLRDWLNDNLPIEKDI